jgi:hypothetical protein
LHHELPEHIAAGFGDLPALRFYVLFHALTYQA